MSSAPGKRFILYVSDPRNAQDNQAVAFMASAPKLLQEQMGLVPIPARPDAPTPVLHDVGQKVTTAVHQTFDVLASLARMAQDKGASADVERTQAERRAALLGGAAARRPEPARAASNLPRDMGPMVPMPDGHPGSVRGRQPEAPVGAARSAAQPPSDGGLRAAGGVGTAGGKLSFYAGTSGLGTSIQDTFLMNPQADGLQSENAGLGDQRRVDAMRSQASHHLAAQFGGSGKGAQGVAAHSGYATHAPPSHGISMVSDAADSGGPATEDAIKRLREQSDEKFKQVQQGKAVITAEPDTPVSPDKIGLGSMAQRPGVGIPGRHF